MKKFMYAFLCIAVGLVLGFPLFNMNDNYMSAAEGYEGEKIIDFDAFLTEEQALNGQASSIYMISDEHRLFYKQYISWTTASMVSMVLDVSGRPVEHVVQVSGGGLTVDKPSGIALRDDGKLYVWGDNSCGQFGNGSVSSEYSRNAIVVDPGIPNIVSVHAGYRNHYVVSANGDVYASGDNSYGQLGNGSTEASSSVFTKVNISNVKKITGEGPSVYALKQAARKRS